MKTLQTNGTTYNEVAKNTTAINIIFNEINLIVIGEIITNINPITNNAKAININLNFEDLIALLIELLKSLETNQLDLCIDSRIEIVA